MTIPALPPLLDAVELDVVSRCIAHYRADDLSLNLVSGQVGTFARGATATLVDTSGASFTAANQQPRFEPRDWLGTSARTHMGLLMGASDRLHYAVDWRPMACAIWVEFIEAGTIGTASAGVISVCNDAVTGARLVLDSTGTFYRIRHHNGTTEVTATLGVAPTAGQRVVLRGQLYADGSVQLWQAINGGAETATSRTGTNALGTSWAASSRLRFNAVGTGNAGSIWIKRVKVVAGLPDYATLARQF